MAGRAKPKVVKDTTERWLLTYSDLMNLLLILFIILYTMSKVDGAKYSQVSTSLRSAMGASPNPIVLGNGGGSLIDLGGNGSSTVVSGDIEQQRMNEVVNKVSEIIQKEKLGNNIEVTMEERGVVISIREQIAFKSGSADIEPSARETIVSVGQKLLLIPGNQIKVEGHTDTDPINIAKFPSNWELSSARATNVLRLLVDKVGISPKIISAVGYGEYRPRVPNTSNANKAVNRRVDIVIIKNIYDKVEAGTSKKINVPADTAPAVANPQNTKGQ